MRARWLACACVLAAGCDRVLGLDDVHIGTDAAAPRHVTVDFTQRVYAGIALADALFDPVGVVVRTPSGTRLDVQHTGLGTYAFDTFADEYDVEIVLAHSPFSLHAQHSVNELHLVDTAIGRTDALPAPAGTTIDLTKVSGPAVSPADQLFTLEPAGAQTAAAASTFDWSGRPLLDTSKGDLFYDLEYTADPSTGAVILGAYAPLSATLTAGANHPAGTRVIPTNGTCHVQADPAALATAMTANAPGFTLTATAWGIYAMPGIGAGVDVSSSWLMRLGGKSFPPPVPPPVDVMQACFDPIPQSNTAITMAVDLEHTLVGPGTGGGITVSFAAMAYAPAFAGSNGSGQPTADQVALPHDVMIAGTALSQDKVGITLDPGADAVVTWQTTGTSDYAIVNLLELVEVGNTTSLVYVDAIVTASGHATLPAEDLRIGHFYMVNVATYRGAPMASSGDFRPRSDASGVAVFPAPYFFINVGS